MDPSSYLISAGLKIAAQANCTIAAPATVNQRPPVYKAIGISLAIASGVFIGISFVFKKLGLLKANVKYNEEAGEGYGYLKNAYWWTGMTLMIIGEICNFVAYAFVDAILVTPLGALSVVITTILSAIFLKERLSFVGKIGCFMCIIGSVVIVMNAPAQSSAANIQEMQHFVIAPGFLSYAGVIILICVFIAFWAGPRYGKKSMLVYLSICSLIGGLSVVATQGLGAAVVAQAGGQHQFNHWFLYVLLVFVVTTLLTEIIFLNKALNLFNAALVTPTYYVFFTSATIISGAILFQGFKGSVTSIITVVMGFFQICAGVVLLQLSKSAKDVPDAAVFTGDLDQVRTVAEQEQPESEPKADAIRGTAAIIRQLSHSRGKMEAAEAKRVYEDKMKDRMEPIGENEQVEWDGLRRRKTTLGGDRGLHRRKTLHPPLGLTHFIDEDESDTNRPMTGQSGTSRGLGRGFFNSFRRRTTSGASPEDNRNQARGIATETDDQPDARTDQSLPPYTGIDSDANTQYSHQPDGAMEMNHVYGLPPGLQPSNLDGSADTHYDSHNVEPSKPIAWANEVEDLTRSHSSPAPEPPVHGGAKRQFSFQNVFNRHKHDPSLESTHSHPRSRRSLGSRHSSRDHGIPGLKTATEEERLGLVKGDSSVHLEPLPDYQDEDEETTAALPLQDEYRYEGYTRQSQPPQLRNVIPETGRLRMDDDEESNNSEPEQHTVALKEWEHRSGGGGSGSGGGSRGGPGAFI